MDFIGIDTETFYQTINMYLPNAIFTSPYSLNGSQYLPDAHSRPSTLERPVARLGIGYSDRASLKGYCAG
jgi:hypothetical protein